MREVVGRRHTAPATPGDLLFHLRARRMDLCFELASHLTNRLAGQARVYGIVSSLIALLIVFMMVVKPFP